MGKGLALTIRYNSVDDVSEVFGRFTEAALVAENSFSFDQNEESRFLL